MSQAKRQKVADAAAREEDEMQYGAIKGELDEK